MQPVTDRKLEVSDARDDLMSEIRKGFQLKPATVSINIINVNL